MCSCTNAPLRDGEAVAKVGQSADLVLMEADPSKRIGGLRNTRTVMMDADELWAASGFSGRPVVER